MAFRAAKFLAVVVIGLASLSAACASEPARPFNTLKDSQVTALRLQNYEPPPPPPGAGQPGAAAPAQQVPQQIQQWLQAGAQGLEALIPPGMLPPGGLQGMANALPIQPPQPPPEQVPRFHNFRILGQTAVMSPEVKEQLAELFGDEDNFQTQHLGCLYPEMGLSFSAMPNTPPNDVLISFACKQVMPVGFTWPHGNKTGMTSDLVKELTTLVQKIWPVTG